MSTAGTCAPKANDATAAAVYGPTPGSRRRPRSRLRVKRLNRQIEALVRNTFGPQMGYAVELVDAIPQEASGKYRFCVSPVATAYLKSLAP